jgi:quinol-cytochrome oxidoreductase complex cytochrome b subunit
MRRCCMATRIPGLLLGLRVLNNDFLPFYAILRAIPSKLGGVSAMLGALVILLPLSIFNTYQLRSTRYRLLLLLQVVANQINIISNLNYLALNLFL